MKTTISIIAIMIFYIGCVDDTLSSRQFEETSQEFKTVHLTTQTELVMEVNNGEITLIASDTAASMYVNIIKSVRSSESGSDAADHLSDIVITTEENRDYIKFKVENPDDARDYNTRFNIIMPNNFNFNLELGNGDINISSRTKRALLSLGNGNINAGIVLIDTCFIRFSLGNGNIQLSVPQTTNALVTSSVGNGNIINNGLNFQNQQSNNRQFSGRLGSGAGSIMLSVGNGTITMNKM